MKKILSFLLVACFTVTLFGQTIVSTTPSDRNMILEEFTGKTCQYCPDGHKRAQQLMNQYPGRFFAINVHQGGYASGTPNYTTPYGNALATQAGMGQSGTGYPAGTVNRQAFSGVQLMGSPYLYDRGRWAQCASIGISQASSVNVAAAGTLDLSTRHLSLLVEVYYTSNAVQSTNKLTVAMLQNEILGPQTGGAQYYPEMMVGSQYRHMHMLRDYVTGTQWGMDISPTTTGSFWSKTFEYDIPQHFNNIDVVLEELEFLVFVAENQQTIITGSKADITFVGLPDVAARIDGVTEIPVIDCSSDAGAYITVKNVGQNPITSAEISYTVAGGTPKTFVWDKRTISSMATDTIHLPSFQVQVYQNQVINVNLVKANGVAITTPAKNLTIKKDVVEGDDVMKLVIRTDQYGSECTFKIFNPDGTVLLSGGPFTNAVVEREFDFIPVMEGCHRLEVNDSYGDGMPGGYIRIFDSGGTMIYHAAGASYGSKLTAMVTVSLAPQAPTNFLAQQDGNNVILSWEGNSDSYKLFFNGTLIKDNITAKSISYTHLNVPAGEHIYGVQGVKGGALTAITETSIIICGNDPENLTAQQESNSVVLTWEAGYEGGYSFKVFHDGEMLAENIKTKTYTHQNAPVGEHTYGVLAVIGACSFNIVEKKIEVLGINDFENNIKIYPNPAQDYLFIEGIDIESVIIYNNMGQLIQKIIIVDEINSICTKDLNAGLFHLLIQTKLGVTHIGKFVIAK